MKKIRVHLVNGEVVIINNIDIEEFKYNLNNFKSDIQPITLLFDNCVFVINNVLYVEGDTE